MKKVKEYSEKFPAIVYGLDGIMQLFKCSKPRASRLANTVLKDSVSRQGNLLVIDTVEALRLFGIKNPERFVM